MTNKFRGGGKIKREHDMIADLEHYLVSIESIPEIQSIVTGVITTRRGSGGFTFEVKHLTATGLRCLAKNQGSVQEVYITSSEPMLVWQKIDGDI